MSETSLWVFGYGSLCWRPGFDYGDSVVGHINGYSRRFWQGNATHRGTVEKPGRVATLLQDENAKTHGIAFQLLGENALQYLEKRECTLGGYVTHMTNFQPRDKSKKPFPVLLYMATPSNHYWMGPAPLQEVAEQVVNCSGDAGHNVEYVLRLAHWVRQVMPDVRDDHLFTLETHVRFKIKEKNLCLKSMMSNDEDFPHEVHENVPVVGAAAGVGHHEHDEEHRTDSFAFASNVGRKDLRCLKV